MKELFRNKKAYFQYEIFEKYEAGIVLEGTEVKSLKNDCSVDLTASFVKIDGSVVWLINCHIGEYSFGNMNNHKPRRDRRLLLKKKEIRKLKKSQAEKNMTIVPLAIYVKRNGLIKLSIASARGKKQHDKREARKLKDIERKLREY